MITIASILYNDLANGPNLRTVLFVQGCPHHCKGCHNQHTWSFTDGVLYTADELYKELTCNPLDKGITISGGEPICQWEELHPVIQQLKDKNYHLMLYTGYTRTWLNNKIITDDLFLDFLSLFDMIVTGPYIEQQKVRYEEHLIYGSYNQEICKIDNGKLIKIN
jgi:anaerobic ribonucleoside-triphosphate reductase activating protein